MSCMTWANHDHHNWGPLCCHGLRSIHWYINRIDEECKGVVWGFSWLGATCWRFGRKTQKEPANCLYSVLYTVYSVLLSPLWLKSVPGWPAISVSTWQQSRVGQIVWFGWLSAISQLVSRVGEGGGVRQLCLHSVTQPYTTCPRWREQGGLCSLPFGLSVSGDWNSRPPHQWPMTNERTVPWECCWAVSFNTQKQGHLANTEQLLTNSQPEFVVVTDKFCCP
jgi:hypothetical protein